MSKIQIEEAVRSGLKSYLHDLNGTEPDNLHDMLLRIVEKPLLEVVLKHTRNNQSRAAKWLGMNRNTLRKKLLELNLPE